MTDSCVRDPWGVVHEHRVSTGIALDPGEEFTACMWHLRSAAGWVLTGDAVITCIGCVTHRAVYKSLVKGSSQ